jgi:AraC-like DNA-binding protein
MRLDVIPDESVPWRAEIDLHKVPSTFVATFLSTPMTYIRSKAEARSGNSGYTLVMARRDSFRFYGDGQDEVFANGGAVLLFNGRSGSIDAPDGGEMRTVGIDGPMLRAAVREIDERAAHPLGFASAPLRLLDQYIASVLENVPLDRPLDHAVNTHITDLLALALRPNDEELLHSGQSAVRAARFTAMRADILANFSQVRLSAKTIAKRHGVSERYVYLLFEQNGLNFSHAVTAERLRRAMTMLLDPRHATTRISDIALAVGFGDLTTFNRAFRKTFGQTPRDVRGVAGR